MLKQKLLSIIIAVISLVICVACGNGGKRPCLGGSNCDASDIQSQVGKAVEEPDNSAYNAANFNCTATPSQSLVNHGEIFSLTIAASGGIAPYSVPGYISSFASTTSLSGGYYNNGSSDRIVQRTVLVKDSENHSAYCSFAVTVRSQTSQSPIACTMSVAPANPRVGEIAEFTINGTGATNFTFKYFSAQPGWNATVSKLGNTFGKVGVIYRTAGIRHAEAIVSAGGIDAICSLPVTVRQPRAEIAASPSLAVIGSPIALTATAISFDPDSPKTYRFTTTEAGISIAANGASATVTATDGRYHNRFNVRVTITNDAGESATATTGDLIFTAAPTLTCRLDAVTSPMANSSAFRATAVNASEALEITEFNGGPDAAVLSGYLANPVIARFALPIGYRSVYVRARGAVSGTPCFDGGTFGTTIQLREKLNRCDVVVNPNPIVEGNVAIVSVTTPANVGVGPYHVVVNAQGGVDQGQGATLNDRRIRYSNASSSGLPVTATVTDLSDNTVVSCQTTANVRENIVTKDVGCSSGGYRYQECHVGGEIRNAYVKQKWSHAGCSYGHSYGWHGERLWVNYGCRALFEVRARIR